MQVVCDGLDLCDAVITVSRAMSPRTTNPILEGIKFIAEGETLTLSATDLELSIEKKIKAEVKSEGETVVPGKFFGELVKKLTAEKIELTLKDEKTLKVSYIDSETVVQCYAVNEYPAFKKIETTEFFGIEQKSFKEMINKTTFSVAVDDTRPILKGCLFEMNQDTLKIVALDGYRLAYYTQAIKGGNLTSNVIVPARSLNEIAKLLEENDDVVNVYVQNNFMMVDLGGCVITTRLFEGDFINYKQIISSDFSTTIRVNRKQFEESLERASLLSKVGQNNLVQFDITDGNLCITSRSEIGNIRENMNITLNGKELAIAFNARYFTEALKVNGDEFVELKFNQAHNPCIITPFDSENPKYLYLILPVRLRTN